MAIYIEIDEKEALALGIERENGRYMKVLATGRVIDTITHSMGFGDSASYAKVVRDDGSIESINYQYTGLGGSDWNHAEKDVTPELLKMAQDYARPHMHEIVIANAEHTACEVSQGKRVRVIKGRKFPIGTEAVAKWAGEAQFGYVARLIFADGSEAFIALGNVEVIDPESYMPSDAEITARVERALGNLSFLNF
jgi:hypothetical protein